MIVWSPCRANCDDGKLVIPQYPAEHDIPICPVCGGLGLETNSKPIRTFVRRLREARFAYCPYDSREHFLFPPPPCLRRRAVGQMLNALYAIRQCLGDAMPSDCYAAELLAESLMTRHISLVVEVEEAISRWRDDPQIKRPTNKELWSPIELAIGGYLGATEDRFRKIMGRHIEAGSESLVYIARFFVEYRRDWLRALTYLEQARDLSPQSAEVHLELVAAYDALHREAEMRLAFMDAMDCPDADDFPTRAAAKATAAKRRGEVASLTETARLAAQSRRRQQN